MEWTAGARAFGVQYFHNINKQYRNRKLHSHVSLERKIPPEDLPNTTQKMNKLYTEQNFLTDF